jgi:hypothetical protein
VNNNFLCFTKESILYPVPSLILRIVMEWTNRILMCALRSTCKVDLGNQRRSPLDFSRLVQYNDKSHQYQLYTVLVSRDLRPENLHEELVRDRESHDDNPKPEIERGVLDRLTEVPTVGIGVPNVTAGWYDTFKEAPFVAVGNRLWDGC